MSLTAIVTELLDLMPEAAAVYTPGGTVLYSNEANLAVFGKTREAFVGKNLWELHPDAVGNAFHAAFQRVATTGNPERCENHYPAWGLWFENRFYAHRGHIYVIARDITGDKAAARRLEVLASISRVLVDGGLDLTSMLDRIVRALTPHVGDSAGVYLADDGVNLRLRANADVDPELEAHVREAFARAPADAMAGSLSGLVFRDGQALLEPDVNPARHPARFPEGPARELVRRVAPTSIMAAPMIAAGVRLGVLAMTRRHPRAAFSASDLDLLQDLASRAALAVANAESYARAEAALGAARDAVAKKDEFLALLGHELRNPLAPIVTALELMRRNSQSPERERAIIERQVAHLARLVDDLLDVARVTRGKVALTKSRLDLADVLGAALEMVEPLLAERHNHVELDVPGSTWFVEGDRGRLAQVFANLLTNASKYGSDGGRIQIRGHADEEQISIEVVDHGVGIGPELLPHVFDAFVQAPQGSDRRPGGLGLGLALARSFVALHAGSIAAVSAGLGKGASFRVSLPRAALGAPTRRAPGEPPAASRRPGPKLRVLVVDDNMDLTELLTTLLEAAGHVALGAPDAPSALRLAQTFKIDAALIDIGLPVMDGCALALELRQLFPEAKLIAATGYGQPEDRARTRAAGFDGHLVKPISIEMLTREFERLLPREALGFELVGETPSPRRVSPNVDEVPSTE